MDYGNTESVSSDSLYQLPAEVASPGPAVVEVRLAHQLEVRREEVEAKLTRDTHVAHPQNCPQPVPW